MAARTPTSTVLLLSLATAISRARTIRGWIGAAGGYARRMRPGDLGPDVLVCPFARRDAPGAVGRLLDVAGARPPSATPSIGGRMPDWPPEAEGADEPPSRRYVTSLTQSCLARRGVADCARQPIFAC